MKSKSVLDKVIDTVYLKILHLKYSYKYFFAHHPLCDNYRNHTYKIGNLYVCKGCFHTYSGFLLFSILYAILTSQGSFLTNFLFNSIYGLLLQLIFLLPLTVDFFNIEVPRIIKNIFRQMLGYSASTSLFVIILSPLIIKLISFVIMVLVYIKLKKARKKKKDDLCHTCNEYELISKDYYCSGYAYMLKKEEEFSKEAGTYLQNKYYNNI